jgi:bifunctional non-homologous end joining protein LigD
MPAKKPPAGEGWLHEPKMDGYRLQIAKEGRRVRLYSRGGYEWTKRLAGLAEALTAIPGRSLVLDAELCCAGADGAPDFAGLQVAMGAGRQHALSAFAFDLLHRDGVDLRPLPLVQRRHLLERLFDRAEIPGLMLVPSFNDGMKLLDAAEQHGLEGVVSKRRSSAYASGPSKTWLKVKTVAWREANRERWRLFE